DGRLVAAQQAAPLQLASVGPTVILLVGLQGSGTTTTAAKLARRLQLEQKAPWLVAAGVYRPAAGEQLRQLGEQVGVPVFPGKGEEGRGGGVVELVRQAVREAEQARCRSVIVDTAWRLQIDTEMMDELRALREAVAPREVLLVADGMMGQDAAAALRLERKARSKKGMDLGDFLVALKQMQAMGPLKQVLGLLPGVNAQALRGLPRDDKQLKHVEAIVLSMTPAERAEPAILN